MMSDEGRSTPTAGPNGSAAKRVTLRTPSANGSHQLTLVTAHRTIAVVDIEGFGQHRRNNINQVRVRDGLYRAMQHAFGAADIPWDTSHREDRGDGILVLAHADVPKALFVDRLPATLASAVVAHNKFHPPPERMRLRLALHAGEITYDDHGVTGSAINHTFRLLDAKALKNSLAGSAAVLAVVGSAWFYDEVIRHSESSKVKSYRPVEISNKETSTKAWVRLLGSTRRRPSSPA